MLILKDMLTKANSNESENTGLKIKVTVLKFIETFYGELLRIYELNFVCL